MLSLPPVVEKVITPVDAALLGTARAAVNVALGGVDEKPLVTASVVFGKSVLVMIPKLQLEALAALVQLQVIAPLEMP